MDDDQEVDMNEVTVSELRSEDTKAAAAVLGSAFVTNPNSLAIWGGRAGDAQRRKQAAVFRIVKLERPSSQVLVAHHHDRLIGVLNTAEWPRCQMSVSAGLRSFPRMLLAMRGAVAPAMFRAMKLQSIWGEHDPDEPHWHLGPVGVLPDFQGRGIGTQLLEAFSDFVDRQRLAAYLETDRPENVAFYERFGFQITGQVSILDVDNRFMWRPAQRSADTAPPSG
jgi:GNAT superfamily N-acetyltransferase